MLLFRAWLISSHCRDQVLTVVGSHSQRSWEVWTSFHHVLAVITVYNFNPLRLSSQLIRNTLSSLTCLNVFISFLFSRNTTSESGCQKNENGGIQSHSFSFLWWTVLNLLLMCLTCSLPQSIKGNKQRHLSWPISRHSSKLMLSCCCSTACSSRTKDSDN